MGKKMARVALLLLAGLVSAGYTSTARALIVDINAVTTTAASPITVLLGAGTYVATPIDGTYEAWNAWGLTDCVTPSPSCAGWLNVFYLSSPEIGTITMGSSLRYPTAAQALAAAVSATFTLTSVANVNFFIDDAPHSDNLGGISLLVTELPEPAVPLALGAGLLLFVVALGRRRRAAAR